MSASNLPTAPPLLKTHSSQDPSGPHPVNPGLVAQLTDDLFLGAYLVAEGARLAGTELEADRSRRRSMISFVIEGEADALEALTGAYRRGQARTNVLRFKSALAHLKDVMFAELRQARAQDDETRGEVGCRFQSKRSNG